MVKSMTGFGRAEAADEHHKITVELKAVNHRYLDLTLKMPKKFNLFETRIRSLMKEFAERGKVDLFMTCEDFSEELFDLKYNSALAAAYVRDCRTMSETFDIPFDLTVSRLASFPDVFEMERREEDAEAVWPLVEQALREAGTAFAAQRAQEGKHLTEDILAKLDGMETAVEEIEARSPEITAQYQERLGTRIREVLEQQAMDEARLLTEVAIFADKTCVDEETVRLRGHIAAMRRALTENSSEGIGRKLDFLAQEMNREANTTLSKCSNLDISAKAIFLKTEIEKIREQVQNIE